MSCAPDLFRRHAFVRLAPDAWASLSADPEGAVDLRDWLARGRPLIVRRPCLSDDGAETYLGLALPGKRRVACRAPRASVISVEPPPVWRGEAFQPPGLFLRAFGSHAWQTLTGLPYLTAASDIDLLADMASADEWAAFLARKPELPPQPRVDLEIVFCGDASFSWREFLGPSARVLVKSNRRVWLERKDRLAALFS